MAELLLELFSEEIPARMQTQAGKDLERLVVGALTDRGLLFEGSKAFAGPRRLTLVLAGLPLKQPDVSEEKKGPRLTAPEKAIEGFLRSAGVTLSQCEKRDDGKGEFYVAVIHRKGRATADVLAEVLPECFAKLPWPKSMRFPGSEVRWVRPLHSILCVFDGEVVPFEFAGVKSGNQTRGHRFLSAGVITAKNFEIYRHDLRTAHVMLDAAERKEIILHEAWNQAFALGLELIEDDGLLEEVAGLNEWPTVLIGTIEDQFMDVPAEILQTSMRTHQKYFSLRAPDPSRRPTAEVGGRSPQDEGHPIHSTNPNPHPEEPAGAKATAGVSKDAGTHLANRFAVVSNMLAEDGGKAIVAGNERVLRARLSDAKFFWDRDRLTRLESRVVDLMSVVFQSDLGDQFVRTLRITTLASKIADIIHGDPRKSERAAWLSKADLLTGVVGEFPELQGVMGRYYALNDKEPDVVANAIRDQYKPQGPTDSVPVASVSIAVALADKLDLLAGFFSIGQKPTGSGDPYALRRAALGVIRIVLSSGIRVPLRAVLANAVALHAAEQPEMKYLKRSTKIPLSLIGSPEFKVQERLAVEEAVAELKSEEFVQANQGTRGSLIADLLSFFADRLKVALKEKGTRYDLIDAVFSLGNEDDLVRLVARVEALQSFLKTEEGANLLAGYKRAANILKAEEKKDKTTFDGAPDASALVLPEEQALFAELETAAGQVKADIEAERFVEAMGVMSRLRAPVDAFFDKVTVNDKDPALRRNRLLLLSRLRATLHLAADFSKIEG